MKATGDCFEVAGRYVLDRFLLEDSPSMTLVHARVSGQGPLAGIRYLHAWIEDGGQVIDRSNGRNLALPIQLYYAVGEIDPSNPEDFRRYTVAEARAKMGETAHFGPWDLEERL